MRAEIVMVQVTDVFGKVESEPLVITVQGSHAALECHGLRMEGFTEEIIAALEPRREIREQAA